MKKNILLSLQQTLLEALTNKDFLNQTSLDKKDILPNIKNTTFLAELSLFFESTDHSCKDILSLCKLIFINLFDDEPKEGWLKYAYEYTLYQSFPSALSIELNSKYESSTLVLLNMIRIIFEFKKNNLKEDNNASSFIIDFLTKEEINNLINPAEYKKFIKTFKEKYVYEMMKLHQEISDHNTLDHICGVHHVALYIARQLYKLEIPIDLARVSGAAAGHDIGKYGCTGSDAKRIPYLHYYYTDQWFKKNNIPHIGHVAVNHSTWDLELENLSLESLILIYADFRVKNNEEKVMHIYSLEKSFEVILNKLDNLTSAKENRYKKVYAKLLDFENYIKNLGVNTDVYSTSTELEPTKKDYVLMHGNEVVENIKYQSIDHNINVMFNLRNETSLSSIIEIARSSNDWKNLRGYLNIFEEYSTYFTQKQKLITLNFLYELLVHNEEDVRKKAAEIIGLLIALFDEEYRKEVPKHVILEHPEITSCNLLDKYLNLLIYPDHKIIDTHKEWLGYSIRIIIDSLFKHCEHKFSKYLDILLKYYNIDKIDDNSQFNLIHTIKYMPLTACTEDTLNTIYDFLITSIKSENIQIRLIALDRINFLIKKGTHEGLATKVAPLINDNNYYSKHPSENYLRYKIGLKINADNKIIEQYYSFVKKDIEKKSDIFLGNLKIGTSWISKKIHIELMLEQVKNSSNETSLHTAMHLCNLIKVSPKENVRINAGNALLQVIPLLSLDQRNDITIELLRGLEVDGFEFGTYIPKYLGQIMLYLHPSELDELIGDFYRRIKRSSNQTVYLLLNTIGIVLEYYPEYKDRYNEDEKIYKKRISKMIGILLIGLTSYDNLIKQESFTVIGNTIFGSKLLNLKEKYEIFKLLAKKLLFLLTRKEENELLFLNNSASLNHIYRFISDYTHYYDNPYLDSPKKIAFFPGTFDPFSLSHKEIAIEIRNLGYEVYLAIDEFSWSKRTQPHMQRWKITSMSIADEIDIYIFPNDISINIANNNNLTLLKNIFPDNDVHIVVGSDVILNASSYKKEIEPDSIHNFSHIVFKRNISEDNDQALKEALKNIKGSKVVLTLPPQYEDISSTLIREYIDKNRDISNLIDPLAQKYIYEYGIYLREPQYKTIVETSSINLKIYEKVSKDLLNELSYCVLKGNKDAKSILKHILSKEGAKIVVLSKRNEILGFSIFHWINSSGLYNEFKNNNISEYIREHSIGRMIIIDGIFISPNCNMDNAEQIILTETISDCLTKDNTYAIYKSALPDCHSKKIDELLKLQGFLELPYENETPVYTVNMSRPCILNLDAATYMKEPFRSNKNVQAVIKKIRKKLQKSLTNLYPGNLVLSFAREALYQKLIDKICSTNNVPVQHLTPKQLGPNICVPFGSILKGYVVPNTATKSLHTEKMFDPNIRSFEIGQYPHYMSLNNQIKTIKSFNRPIILVDDLLNKGYRIKALDPLLKSENIQVKKILVGILSARGKELMDIQGREVDYAYFVPHLRNWFTEASMYPFIGGDSIWRGSYPQMNLLPSINLILPFAYPKFIEGASTNAIFELSKTCIKNSIKLLETIEKEYQTMNEKSLTLKNLGKIFVSPRCPDKGDHLNYDLSLKASHYLYNELENLTRIYSIVE